MRSSAHGSVYADAFDDVPGSACQRGLVVLYAPGAAVLSTSRRNVSVCCAALCRLRAVVAALSVSVRLRWLLVVVERCCVRRAASCACTAA